ncbi:hypothetical protein D1115_03710 [Vibrio alfacsensis]|uniref:HPt domain-containing protein n=2 Tax=Vibrio alfacsensis TaxID=1074311 RepID=A0ABN5PDZ1_9VIBR|nr:hypothetical protein D1115_03710 [Vibrio alfacsensis]
MSQAVIDSMTLSMHDLTDDSKEVKEVAHRLKGATGALELTEVSNLCQQLESNPEDEQLKQVLLADIKEIIKDASLYLKQLGNN